MQKWVQYLGQEEALEESMATHSSILAWGSHEQWSLGRLQSMGHKTVGCNFVTKQQ